MFVSVTNVVTIGVLSSNICEKSGSKQSSLAVRSIATSVKTESSEGAEDLEVATATLDELLLVAEEQTADVYACIITKLLITKRLLWR